MDGGDGDVGQREFGSQSAERSAQIARAWRPWLDDRGDQDETRERAPTANAMAYVSVDGTPVAAARSACERGCGPLSAQSAFAASAAALKPRPRLATSDAAKAAALALVGLRPRFSTTQSSQP
jgi:hypothetical protein